MKKRKKKKKKKKKKIGSMIIMLSSSAGVWGVFVHKSSGANLFLGTSNVPDFQDNLLRTIIM